MLILCRNVRNCPTILSVEYVSHLLHVALDGLDHGGVDDGGKGADGGGTVVVLLASHVLGQALQDL